MTDWIITIPKTFLWTEYEKELAAVAEWDGCLKYKIPREIKVGEQDRCFVVWNGYVRGWQRIVGTGFESVGFICDTTKVYWPPGYYLRRSGPFHQIQPFQPMRGFQGIQRFNYAHH